MVRRRKKPKQTGVTWSPVKKPGVSHMPICKTCKLRPVTDARKDECPFCARNHSQVTTYRNYQQYPQGFNYD